MKNVPSRATGEAMSLTRRAALTLTLGIAAGTLVEASVPDRLQPLFDAHKEAYAAFTAAIDVREEGETEATIHAYDIASDRERLALWNVCAFVCQIPEEHVRKGEFLHKAKFLEAVEPHFLDCIFAAMTGKALRFEEHYGLTPIA